MFPTITHIDDVLPHLDDRFFYVSKKDGYTVVNYVVNTNDTFPPIIEGQDNTTSMIRRECRGIIFYPDGTIMSRPLHKFFNLGERVEVLPHNIIGLDRAQAFEKLDGSMVRPIFIGQGIHWGSKNGITHISEQVSKWLQESGKTAVYEAFANECQMWGMTPIFEWCSRMNKVVIDYPQPDLIMIALRDTFTGRYCARKTMESIGRAFQIPVVRLFEESFESKMGSVKLSEGEEGIVAVTPDQTFIKVKSDWYVKLHKAKEMVSREDVVARLVVEEKIDDVLPLLSPEDQLEILKFQDHLNGAIIESAHALEKLWVRAISGTRKDFALSLLPEEKALASIVFKSLDTKAGILDYEHALKLIKTSILSFPLARTSFLDKLSKLTGFSFTLKKGFEL